MPLGVPGQLVRYRLIERLTARWDQAVLTLRGGPGFGKTTALAQAVRQHALDPRGVDVWYGCGPADRDAGQFASALVRRIGAHAGEDPLESVLRAIASLAPLDVCLILDDVHELGSGTQSADLLGRLIRRLPGTAHVVLAGRTLPEVPLTRLRIAGQVTDLVEDELAFTAPEVSALASALGREAPEEPIFGGWPALVRLALTAHPNVATEFLREEILADLRPADRRTLVALAQLGTASADEVSRVLGRRADPIGLACRLPLIDVLGDGRVRCHDLWRDALNRYPQPDAARLRRRAVRVLIEADRVPEAGGCAIAGGDPEMLALATRELVTRTISVTPVDLAGEWLQAVPADQQDAPEIVLLRAAVVHGNDFQDPRVDPWLDRACDGFTGRGDLTAAAAALGLGVVAAQSRADLPRLAALTQRAAAIPGGAGEPILNVVLCSSQAVLAEMRGDPEAAVRAFEQAPLAAVPQALSLSVYRFWMHCLLMAGRPDDAVALATRHLDEGGSAHSRRSSAVARWCAGDPSDYHDLLAALGSDTALSARDAFVDQCFGVLVSSSGGVVDGHPAPDPEGLPNSRDAAVATNAAATRAITLGDEQRAATLFRRQLERFGLEDALAERHLRRSLAVGYVLEPRLRARWDTARLGPAHRRQRELARALLAARAGRPVPAGLHPASTFCTLPLPWSVELACRLVTAGNPDGARLARWLSDQLGTAVVEQLRRLEAQTAGAAALLRTLPIRPASAVRVQVLGPMQVTATAPARARVRQVLAALVLHRSMTRDHIVDLFWPDFDPADAQRNLRVTLTHLRRLLDPDRSRGQAGYNLRMAGESVSLFESDALRVDLWEFDRWLDEAASAQQRGDSCRQARALAAALDLWRGHPLEDLRAIADLEPMVQRIRVRRTEALLRLGELRLVEGHWQEAGRCAAEAVTEAPFDERAHRLSLAAALQRGERTAIRAAARSVVTALAELGVPPEPTTRVLLSSARQRLGPPGKVIPLPDARS